MLGRVILSIVIVWVPIVLYVIWLDRKITKRNKEYWKNVEDCTQQWLKDIAEHLNKKTTIKIKNGRLHINGYKSSVKDPITMTHYLSGVYEGIIAHKAIGRKK